MKPHGLNLSLEYQIEDNKYKSNISKVEGYIHLDNGRTKVIIPMRSFVANFLRILHSHFSKTATYSVLKTVLAPSGVDTYGIQVGRADRTVTPTDESLDNFSNASVTHTITNITTPTIVNSNCKFNISRTFTNPTANTKSLFELGIKAKDTNSASAKTLLIRDVIPEEELDSYATKSIDYSLEITHDNSTGGFVLNFIKFIYNVIFSGSVTASPMLKTNGTNFASIYATGATAVTASYFSMLSITNEDYGIVVENSENLTSPNTTNIIPITSNLSKGVTEISSILIDGSNTYFTITREFTNTGTLNVTINKIGLLTKSNILLAINNTGTAITLLPNQKLRVTYTLSTTC